MTNNSQTDADAAGLLVEALTLVLAKSPGYEQFLDDLDVALEQCFKSIVLRPNAVLMPETIERARGLCKILRDAVVEMP